MTGTSLGVPLPTSPASARGSGDQDLSIVERGMSGLRFAVCALLLATLPVSERVLGFHVRYELAVPAMVAVVALNALLFTRAKAPPLALGLGLDLLGIFAVLACSGGAANPWSALFLVHVALAAAILPLRTTLALSAFAACLFLALFALPSGACCPNHPENGAFSTHLYGMWVAFALSAGIIATFVTRVRGALEARGREIEELRREAADNARFRALATLAAGTAHELNTPLGTIAVLSHEIAETDDAHQAKRQAEAIGAQVERCRQVIKRLQGGREGRGATEPADIESAVKSSLEAWRAAHPEARVELSSPGEASVRVPLSRADIEAATSALLDNAWYATQARATSEPISVSIGRDGADVLLSICDGGTGVADELWDRLGEPFLTTKDPGQGMGLGLWLVRRAVEEAGGKLEIGPRPPQGTRAVIRVSGVWS